MLKSSSYELDSGCMVINIKNINDNNNAVTVQIKNANKHNFLPGHVAPGLEKDVEAKIQSYYTKAINAANEWVQYLIESGQL